MDLITPAENQNNQPEPTPLRAGKPTVKIFSGIGIVLLSILITLGGVGFLFYYLFGTVVSPSDLSQKTVLDELQKNLTDQQGKDTVIAELQKKITDLESQVVTLQSQSTEASSTIDCVALFGNEWALYADKEAGMSWCYKTVWGEPDLSVTYAQNNSDRQWKISFPKNIAITVTYANAGYRDEDLVVCYSCIDFNMSPTQLKTVVLLSYAQQSEITLISHNDKPGIAIDYHEKNPISLKETSWYGSFFPAIGRDNGYQFGITSTVKDDGDMKKIMESVKW